MKASIITFQDSYNNGALLQAYALEKTLSDLTGERCEILNYHCAFKNKKYGMNLKEKPLVMVNKALSYPIKKKLRRKSDQFKRKYMHITPEEYSTSDEMVKLNEVYDAFFCGSDQIWNPFNTGGDGAFFLDFVRSADAMIAYAPSIAITEMPGDLQALYRKHLNRFKHLSIREESGKAIIEKLTGQNAQVVLDPTLLMTAEDWSKISKPTTIGKPYAFLYFISYRPEMLRFAKRLKEEAGIEIVVSIKTLRDYLVCVKHGLIAKIVSPGEFIGYIQNAEYVITNSFHATAFSINLRKKFFSFGNKSTLARGNSRVTDFLAGLGLSDRFVNRDELKNKDDIHALMKKEIQYQEVHKKLDSLRAQSMTFIKNALEQL